MGTVQLEIVAKSDGPNNRIEAFLEPQSEFLSTRLWIYLSTLNQITFDIQTFHFESLI